MGDLSGKFGRAVINPATKKVVRNDNDAFYEQTDALVGKSIALHCGATIFACAKLEKKLSTREQPTTDVVPPPTTGNNGVVATLPSGVGSVTIQSNKLVVKVDLNKMSAEARASAGLTDCFASGAANALTYHIHDKWAVSDGVGATSCSGANTGGHYDPTWACGGASGALDAACDAGGYCAAPSVAYQCTPAEYAAKRFACEVGDVSGRCVLLFCSCSIVCSICSSIDRAPLLCSVVSNRFWRLFVATSSRSRPPPHPLSLTRYGALALANGNGFFSLNREDNLFPPFTTLAGKSIVFHCNGARALCAELVATHIDGSAPPPDSPSSGGSSRAEGGKGRAGSGLNIAGFVIGLLFFAAFELALLIFATVVCLNYASCLYCASCNVTTSPNVYRAFGVIYLILQVRFAFARVPSGSAAPCRLPPNPLPSFPPSARPPAPPGAQITSICLAVLVFILAVASECHGEGRCVLLITNSAFQAVIGLITAIAHVVLWCPQHVKHRRWVGALAGVDLLLSFAAGLVAIIAVTAHPDGHTKVRCSFLLFAPFFCLLTYSFVCSIRRRPHEDVRRRDDVRVLRVVRGVRRGPRRLLLLRRRGQDKARSGAAPAERRLGDDGQSERPRHDESRRGNDGRRRERVRDGDVESHGGARSERSAAGRRRVRARSGTRVRAGQHAGRSGARN